MFLYKLQVVSFKEREVLTVLKSNIVTGDKVEQESTELVGIVLLGGEEDACSGKRGGIAGCSTIPFTVLVQSGLVTEVTETQCRRHYISQCTINTQISISITAWRNLHTSQNVHTGHPSTSQVNPSPLGLPLPPCSPMMSISASRMLFSTALSICFDTYSSHRVSSRGTQYWLARASIP